MTEGNGGRLLLIGRGIIVTDDDEFRERCFSDM